MALKARIEIDNSELKNGLKDAENQANKSFGNIKSNASNAGKGFQVLSQSINTVARQVNSTSASITSMLSKLGPVGLVIAAGFTVAAGAIAGALKIMNSFANKVFETRKRAASVGIDSKNINEYRALEYAAAKTGVEMDKLEKIIGKLEFAFGKAENGEKKMIDAFHALGLSWEELSKKSPVELLMEMSDAYNRMTQNGQKVKPEFFDILGKRDLQTFNKMKGEKFQDEVANLGIFGFDLTPEQVKQTQELIGAYEDSKKLLEQMQGIIAVNTGMTEKWVKFLNKLNKPGPNAGRATGTSAKYYEGIEDVSEEILRSGKYNREDAINFIRGMQADSGPKNKQARVGFEQYIGQLELMTDKEFNEELQKILDNVDFKKLKDNARDALWKVAENTYPEDFDVKNPNKWKRRRRNSPEELSQEQIAKENVEGEAKRLIKEFENMSASYEGASRKAEKLVNVTKEISRLNEKLRKESGDNGAEIDKQLQAQLRINAAKQNELSIENELTRLRKQNISIENSIVGNVIAKAGGPNADIMQQVIKTLEDYGTEMFGADFNLREDFMKKLNKQFSSLTGIDEPLSVSDMLNIDPNALRTSFNKIAEDYRKGFERPTEFDLQNRADLVDLTDLPADEEEYQKALKEAFEKRDERIKKVLEMFDQINKLLKSAEDANNILRNFDYMQDLEKLQTARDMYQAQIAGNYGAQRTLRLKQTTQMITRGANDPEAATQAARVHQLEEENRLLKERASLKKSNDIVDIENQIKSANIRGEYDEAKRLQKILELRKRELDIVRDQKAMEKELAEAEKNRENAAKNIVAEQMKGRKDNALKQVYDIVGQGNKFEEDQLVENVKKQLNVEELPTDFEDLFRKFSRMTNDIPDVLRVFRENAKPQANIIQTNELARRGGFAESVVVEKRDNTDRMVELMKNSEKLISTIKDTATKIDNKLKVNQ